MPQKEAAVHPKTPKKVAPAAPPVGPASAPELPAHVARQYGLHAHAAPAKTTHAATPEATTAEPVTKPEVSVLVNDEVDAAVDDIMAAESGASLAIDATPDDTPQAQPAKRTFWQKVGGFFAAWWHLKWARYTTLAVLLLGIGSVVAVPQTRYWALNTAGVRSSASVVVLDTATRMPLKNVTVQLAGQTLKTDRQGKAAFDELRLGPTTLAIKRVAFAPENRKVTIGWGSNPFGNVELRATGIQYVLYATDYLSGKAVPGAEAVSDEANALADKNGKIVLTVDDNEATTLAVSMQADGYREERLTLDAERDEMAPKVTLVPAVQEVFVSKQSGRYDMYAMDVDGKNKRVLLPGTGSERSNISLVVSPDSERAALVSTRESIRDADGFLLSTLTLVNIADGTSTTVDRGAQIQLIDWNNNRLIYRIAASGASAANSQRYRLISYNYETNAKTQLATANQFTVSMGAQGAIYYAASSNDPKATMGLFKVKPDGTDKKKVFDGEIWTGLRATYDSMYIQTPDGWYSYAIGDQRATPTTAPSSLVAYLFMQGPKGDQSAWVDQRDGKGTLLLYDAQKDKTTVLLNQEGLAYPVRWASDKAIIYRVANGDETADYAVSPNGGEGRKITDVTTTYGFSQGY